MEHSTNVCMFCGSSFPAGTAAHVWPDWFREGCEAAGPSREQLTHDVCEACHSGWIRGLDDAVAPIIEAPMLKGAPARWPGADQRTLAVWVIKTVMVTEYPAARDPGRFFTDNERWLLMRMLDPPSNDMKVWAAASSGDRRVRYHASRVNLLRQASGSLVGDAFIATIAAGQIAFQMAARRFFEPRPDLDEVVFPSEPPNWRDASTPLWPPDDTVRVWPPARALEAEDLEAFGTRWNERLNIGGSH